MEDKINIIKLIGLPDTFAVVLLTFSFILMLAPYFSGADFGLFKIPQFTELAQKKLKIIGPIIFLALLILFIPIIPKRVPAALNNANSGNTNKQNTTNNAPVNRDDNPTPTVAHQVQQLLRRAKSLNDDADFDAALIECKKVLDLEPENLEALNLKKEIEGNIEIRNRYRKN